MVCDDMLYECWELMSEIFESTVSDIKAYCAITISWWARAMRRNGIRGTWVFLGKSSSDHEWRVTTFKCHIFCKPFGLESLDFVDDHGRIL